MESDILQKQALLTFKPKDSFTILCKGHVVNVPFSVITHISKHGHETVIHTLENKWRTYHSLQEILHDLPVNDFFRIHKSHVISLPFMQGISKNKIRVAECYLPFTKYYKGLLLTHLKKRLAEGYENFAYKP